MDMEKIKKTHLTQKSWHWQKEQLMQSATNIGNDKFIKDRINKIQLEFVL